ncbi:putative inorganic phosphate cotransporter isoform X2 [Arctopsyche grandis]
MLFFCMAIAYVIRTSISVTVIAMVDTTNTSSSVQIFDWNKKIQNYVLGSFYWGYVFMQIPAGQLSYRYGGKWFVGLALIINGFISFVIPFAAGKGGWKAVCVCRSLQGFSQGFVIPSFHTLLGRWAPFAERNRMGNFIYTGSTLGTILAMPFSGYLSSTKYGWPSIFYLIGCLSTIIGSLWLIFGADSPAKHKNIPFGERNYIEMSLGQVGNEKMHKAPWKKILLSKPFLATAVAHLGAVWGFFTVLNEMPTFLKTALGVNVSQSGFLSAIPYLVSWITLLIYSTVADYLINNKIMEVTTMRKMNNTIGTWGPATAMVLLTFVPERHFYLTMAIVVLMVSLDAINSLGFFMNYIDLSPKFAGMLVSVGNCLATTVSNLGPIITGLILKDPTSMQQWRLVFLVPAGIYFCSNLIFLIFGKGDRQTWDIVKGETAKDVDEELIEKN